MAIDRHFVCAAFASIGDPDPFDWFLFFKGPYDTPVIVLARLAVCLLPLPWQESPVTIFQTLPFIWLGLGVLADGVFFADANPLAVIKLFVGTISPLTLLSRFAVASVGPDLVFATIIGHPATFPYAILKTLESFS